MSLRIGAVFIVWIAGVIGIAIPFYFTTEEKESVHFKFFKSCAAGVMLGIALMHLLPEADEALADASPDYPLAFALTAFGIVLNLTLEHVALMFLATQRKHKKEQRSLEQGDQKAVSMEALEHGEHCGFVKCEHNGEASHHADHSSSNTSNANFVTSAPSNPNYDSVPCDAQKVAKVAEVSGHHDEHEHHEEELVAGLLDAVSLKELVSLYAMEMSVFVHSVIIGVDIGLLAGNSQLPTLVSLLCAISFHQVIEGMGLGTVLRSVLSASSYTKIMVFVTIFTLSTPVGIIIGICTSSLEESSESEIAKGTANSLAAGSLLYISLTEMVGNYFSAKDLADRPRVQLGMIGCFSLGIAFMALIAIWG